MLEAVTIDARGITKAYRVGSLSTTVLNGVDLKVEKGECVFLVGPSGSGKSTLLSILGCILSADSGVIRMLGQDVTRFGPKEKAAFRRKHIGFVFQRFHLFRGLTARENVRVPMDLLGYPTTTANRECDRLLAAAGIAEKANSHISQLSMGQRQRVALARALAGNPDLILADEPTASLDATSGMNAMTLLRDLTQKMGKAVVVVTHDSRIFPMADRILHLENGLINRSVQPSAVGGQEDTGISVPSLGKI